MKLYFALPLPNGGTLFSPTLQDIADKAEISYDSLKYKLKKGVVNVIKINKKSNDIKKIDPNAEMDFYGCITSTKSLDTLFNDEKEPNAINLSV